MLKKEDLVVGKRVKCVYGSLRFGSTGKINRIEDGLFFIDWDDGHGDIGGGWSELSSFDALPDEEVVTLRGVSDTTLPLHYIPVMMKAAAPAVCPKGYYGLETCTCGKHK